MGLRINKKACLLIHKVEDVKKTKHDESSACGVEKNLNSFKLHFDIITLCKFVFLYDCGNLYFDGDFIIKQSFSNNVIFHFIS